MVQTLKYPKHKYEKQSNVVDHYGLLITLGQKCYRMQQKPNSGGYCEHLLEIKSRFFRFKKSIAKFGVMMKHKRGRLELL